MAKEDMPFTKAVGSAEGVFVQQAVAQIQITRFLLVLANCRSVLMS